MIDPLPQPPVTSRAVARAIAPALGGEPRVWIYRDEPEDHAVAIVGTDGTPSPTLSTYATASLHAYPNLMDGSDIRVELLMVVPVGEESAGNIISTAAFCVVKDRWLAAPGVVFPNVVREFVPQTTVPHLMWVEPFDVESLGAFTVPDLGYDVHALQAVPVSEAEVDLLYAGGFYALTDRLEAEHVPHDDLHRRSVC